MPHVCPILTVNSSKANYMCDMIDVMNDVCEGLSLDNDVRNAVLFLKLQLNGPVCV